MAMRFADNTKRSINNTTLHTIYFSPLLVSLPLPHDSRNERCCSEAVIFAAREANPQIVHEDQEVAVRRVEELQAPLVSPNLTRLRPPFLLDQERCRIVPIRTAAIIMAGFPNPSPAPSPSPSPMYTLLPVPSSILKIQTYRLCVEREYAQSLRERTTRECCEARTAWSEWEFGKWERAGSYAWLSQQ